MSERRRRRRGGRPEDRWEKQTFKMAAVPPGWTCKPGYKIFVADRGAVRFAFPEHWLVIPAEDSIKFHDRRPPDDDCVLAVSVMRLPPVQGGWEKLPLEQLVRAIPDGDSREVTAVGDVVTAGRPGLEIAWLEVKFIDPNEKRPALSRACLARANNVQPLITMDFWESDLEKFGPVWDEVLRTLHVGESLKLTPKWPRADLN
jgi:hypothetical protein